MSVPVLSVQMIVVEPRVSTASRSRTSTLRFAICSAPHARVSVTVGSSASGTSATVTPTAKMKPCDGGLPSSREMPKNAAPTPRAITAMRRTTRRSSRASGVTGFGVAVLSSAISASRVWLPVASTIAWPSPSTTNVPA